MAITTTPEQLIINDMLPEELRDYNRVLDKKGLNGLLTRIAKEYPDKYPDIAFKLMQFGQHMAYISGGESFGLSDLRPAPIVKRFREELDRDIQEILKRNYKKGKESDDPDVRKEVQAAIDSWSELVRSGAKEYAKETENPLYDQAFGTGSLKKNIFESILGTDIQYQDADNNPVDIPILESYSEGLSPVSYFAGATGTRKGIVDLQKATQDAGYLAKQLVQIAHRNVIVDRDGEDEYDESRPLGYPVPTDDPDNEGSFLAHPVAGYPRNTLLTPKILNDIRRQGADNILVRSAIVGGPTNGGLYAYDAGIRERGDLPATGDFVGISAAQSISEPLTQASISCLHPSTLVRMGDGSTKRLRDIRIGDVVMGSNLQGFTRPVTVTNKFENGVQPVYLTTYRKGSGGNIISILATLQHKALQFTRKSSCKGEIYNNAIRELPIGEPGKFTSCILAAGPEVPFEGKHEPRALFMGLMLGDGCYTDGVLRRPHFSCADPSLIEDTLEYMSSINLRFSFHKGSQCYYRVSSATNDGNGDNTRNPARCMLEEYDMIGLYAHDKAIPQDVVTWSTESVAALISGLIITDGSIYKPRQHKYYHVSFASTSMQLVTQVRELIKVHCGAECASVHTNTFGNRKRPLYSIVYAKPVEVIKLLRFLRLYGVKEPLRLRAINEYTNQFCEKLYGCRRISQEFIGNVETLDIEVDHPDHLFVLANGMVVSNSKHSGGSVGADAARGISGFQYINQLLQVPKHFPGGATHSEVDGIVDDIIEAPQGGKHVMVGGKQHYVGMSHGHQIGVKVNKGDVIEAGDVLSDGIPNPAQIVKHKGLGEGRRYYVDTFRQAIKDAGSNIHRRNIEVLSKGVLGYVRLKDEIGDYAPNDVMPYSMIANSWQPREGYLTGKPSAMVGRYLERPVLHYTIGTRIQPSMAKKMEEFGVSAVDAHDEPPPFEPEMIRGMAHVANDPDWATRFLGSYNKNSLLESARRGGTSNLQGTSYVPRVAFGDAFGDAEQDNIRQTRAGKLF